MTEWVVERRWFRGRRRRVRSTRIADVLPVNGGERGLALVLLEVTYSDGEPEIYSVPLAMVDDTDLEPEASLAVARFVRGQEPAGYLVDAAGDPAFVAWLVRLLSGRRRVAGRAGELVGRPTAASASILGRRDPAPHRGPARRAEQHLRPVGGTGDPQALPGRRDGREPGDRDGSRAHAARLPDHAPATAGWLEYHRPGGVASIAVMQAFIPNRGDAFHVARNAVENYLETVLGLGIAAPEPDASIASILVRSREPVGDGEIDDAGRVVHRDRRTAGAADRRAAPRPRGSLR